jgi:uncharacterized protein (DUF305 family)
VRNWNVAYALLLVVAILVAVASLYLLATSQPPGEGSAEAGFARDMTVHHAQAVEMAEIVRDTAVLIRIDPAANSQRGRTNLPHLLA